MSRSIQIAACPSTSSSRTTITTLANNAGKTAPRLCIKDATLMCVRVCMVIFFSSRVAEYGFSKLIELFEAVPGTVEVTEDPNGERLLQLTDSERLKVT